MNTLFYLMISKKQTLSTLKASKMGFIGHICQWSGSQLEILLGERQKTSFFCAGLHCKTSFFCAGLHCISEIPFVIEQRTIEVLNKKFWTV